MTIDNGTKIPKLVIDASVAVKWFAFEPDTPQARVIFQSILERKIIGLAPDLLFYEVANSLWKSKKSNAELIAGSLDTLTDCGIQFQDLEQVVYKTAINFMISYNLTFYDSVYAALAKLLDAPLLTANSKDHKKIKEIEVVEL